MQWQDRLKSRRTELGMSCRTLANKVGITHTTICRYESGEIENMSVGNAGKIAKVLNCSPLWLCGWSDDINAGMEVKYANSKDKQQISSKN